MAGYSGTPLVQKIGVKPASVLLLVNPPRDFDKELAPLPKDVHFAGPRTKPVDVTMFFTSCRKDFEAGLTKLQPRMAQNGMLWVSWPKKASGMATDLNENLIREIGLAAGLVDVKVCAVNDVWSGLKFVIPIKDRVKN